MRMGLLDEAYCAGPGSAWRMRPFQKDFFVSVTPQYYEPT